MLYYNYLEEFNMIEFSGSLDKILESYNITNYKIQKFRSVYKISTKDRNILLKGFNSKTKVLNTKIILSHLYNNNFKFCQKIFYNNDDQFYFSFNNKYYSCFSWIDGKEVNLKEIKNIKRSIKSIYLFHKSLSNLDYSYMEIKDNSNWDVKFEESIINLYDIKNTILNKTVWCCVDKFYYENIDTAIKILHNIVSELYRSDIRDFLINNKSICHDSLYYQNLILKKKDVYLIDFGGICINNSIYDLSKFARRVFYKNKFDVQLLNEMFDYYNLYYKFNDIEKRLFNLYMKYPYKFVKFGVRFYLRNKEFEREKLINKLKKYAEYELSN